MGQDNFPQGYATVNTIAPANFAEAITPHDTNELSVYCRAIYVGGAGDLKITTVGGNTVTFVGVSGGIIYPIRAKVVFATGTTATDLVALY